MTERREVTVRLAGAAAEARGTVRQCDVLGAVTAARRAKQLTARCAWCNRFELRGRWLDLSDLVSYTGGAIGGTHGICPECLERLLRSTRNRADAS